MLDQIAFFLVTISSVGVAFIGAYVLWAIMHLPAYFRNKR